MKRKIGTVYLVGAGPGDPKLLTVRAHELLTSCDVLAYDELVPEAILSLAPKRAERIAVGRRANGVRHHEGHIHFSVLARALAGRDVVRLKGGDPMIFGRGGEELAELRAKDIPYEVVPGITSALGAAAALAFPLTHREVSSAVTIRTGKKANAGTGETLVFYMGLAEIDSIARDLVTRGFSSSTPALVVASATRPEQKHVVGTLETIASLARRAALDSPALLFVGDVVTQARAQLRLVHARTEEARVRSIPV